MQNHEWKYVIFLSIFDHWLSESEANESNVLTYGISSENKSLKLYFEGEKSFVNFYKSIGSVVFSINDEKSYEVSENDFQELLIAGLREEKAYNLLYNEFGLMIKSGYDRTDVLFISDFNLIPMVCEKAKLFNLHVLEIVEYSEYIKDMDV